MSKLNQFSDPSVCSDINAIIGLQITDNSAIARGFFTTRIQRNPLMWSHQLIESRIEVSTFKCFFMDSNSK